MNSYIIENFELEDVKLLLAECGRELPESYSPNCQCVVSFTEEDFYTLAKRVANLELQNRENAKLKLSDFSIGDIMHYLIENDEVKAVLHVDESHEYDIKSNFFHIHGSGEERLIIVR